MAHVRELNDAYVAAVAPHRTAIDALAKLQHERLLDAPMKKARSKAGPVAALLRPV